MNPKCTVQTPRLGRGRRLRGPVASVLMIGAGIAVAGAVSGSAGDDDNRNDKLTKIQHIVVIYEENHSFDNLYGRWEGVNGRSKADAAHTIQIGQGGAAYYCLKQNDVNLSSPPLASDCADATTPTRSRATLLTRRSRSKRSSPRVRGPALNPACLRRTGLRRVR